MNKLHSILLELMKIALNPKDQSSMLINESEWPELYKLIIEQGMGSILFPVIDSLPDASKPNHLLYDQWKKRLFFTAVEQLRRTQCLKRIIDVLNSAHLPFIVIKGPAIARFYHRPEYRIMGDLDILVEDKYIQLAQQTIDSMGYTLIKNEKNHPFHFEYYKQMDLPIELHYSLYSPGLLGKKKTDDLYDHIWRHRKSISFNSIEFFVMTEEDELINQILHYVRHMIHQGAKMKNIYDMALIIQHCGKELDWIYIRSEMENLQILKFATVIFTICNTFFNIEIPESLHNQTNISPDVFLDRFLNYYSVEMDGDPEHKTTWTKLTNTIPFLCKSLLTLPVVYIIDFMVQFIKNKRGIKDALSATRNNMKLFANYVQTLKGLGLI